MVMGLLAVQFIDVSSPGRCGPYDKVNKKVKTERNRFAATSQSFEQHLREHAKSRVSSYFEVLMVSNMCTEYEVLGFKDIFRKGATTQDTGGSRTQRQDINQVDAAGLMLPGTTIWTFGNTHAAHVVALGLEDEQLSNKCNLRKVLEKMISRTTEQVAEVNLTIDRRIDKKQFNFGEKHYRSDKKVTKHNFQNFVRRLKKSIEKYRNGINLTDANKQSRLEFYADTYLDVIDHLEWRDICKDLECKKDNVLALAKDEGWSVKENVLGDCL